MIPSSSFPFATIDLERLLCRHHRFVPNPHQLSMERLAEQLMATYGDEIREQIDATLRRSSAGTFEEQQALVHTGLLNLLVDRRVLQYPPCPALGHPTDLGAGHDASSLAYSF